MRLPTMDLMSGLWSFTGCVTSGRQLGRTLGFPTANIEIADNCPALDGVYRARVEVNGKAYDAMANLGSNPTIGACTRRLESHLFDFDGTLYGETIRVTLLEKIRDEQTFDSVEELKMQLERDRERILKRLRTTI